MNILNEEYEEISVEEAYIEESMQLREGVVTLIENGKVRYFRKVKPAPEFPVKIEMSCGDYLEIFKDGDVNFYGNTKNIIVSKESKEYHDQDINGILKALLYLETEDDIIKRLKELR